MYPAMMRRAPAHLLLLFFSWMLIAPLFAQNPEANLPACCRKNGKHHCMMRSMARSIQKGAGFASIAEKCPCLPPSTAAAHSIKFAIQARPRFNAEAAFHPAWARQTESRSRILLLGSHQKRGPPSPQA